MYVELRWIIAGVGAPHRDATIIAWEHALFPVQSVRDARAATARRRAERVAAPRLRARTTCWSTSRRSRSTLRGRRDAFVSTMLALTVVYGVCFVTYALFPSTGRGILVGAAAAPDGPMRRFVLTLLDRGSSRGTAFPSSHVAASSSSALCALRYQRRGRRRGGAARRCAHARHGLRRLSLRGGRARRRDPRRPAWLARPHSLERLASRGSQSATAA